MTHLYTVICEYDGGTYIAQVKASSPKDAVAAWASARALTKYIPKAVLLGIKDGLDGDPPVAIEGCRNVWCCGASTKKGLVLINLVRTYSERRLPS